jgi:transposase-like protein
MSENNLKNKSKINKSKTILIKTKCKYCGYKHCIKMGFTINNKGNKQRYQCKKCKKKFVLRDNRYNLKKYPLKLREQVIKAYLSKTSIRGIEYTFNIHNSLISKWIKSCGKKVKELQDKIKKSDNPKIIDVLEVDELFTYIKKNR